MAAAHPVQVQQQAQGSDASMVDVQDTGQQVNKRQRPDSVFTAGGADRQQQGENKPVSTEVVPSGSILEDKEGMEVGPSL